MTLVAGLRVGLPDPRGRVAVNGLRCRGRRPVGRLRVAAEDPGGLAGVAGAPARSGSSTRGQGRTGRGPQLGQLVDRLGRLQRGRTAVPNTSTPGQPTVHSPEVNLSSRVGVNPAIGASSVELRIRGGRGS